MITCKFNKKHGGGGIPLLMVTANNDDETLYTIALEYKDDVDYILKSLEACMTMLIRHIVGDKK